MIGTGLTIEGIVAVDAAIGIANQPASLAIDREVIKVEEISASRASSALQADSPLLNGIVGRRVNLDPVSTSVVGRSDVEVPNVLTIEGGAIWITGATSGNAGAGA